MARTELQSAPRLIQSGYSFSISSYSARAVVVCLARRSKSWIYFRVSPMIRGLSSFPTRLCPAITARGLSDSILSRQQSTLGASADLATLTDADDRRCRRHHLQRSNRLTEREGRLC